MTSSVSASELSTATYFESIKDNHDKLQAFLEAMPKGGDLHMHLTGSTFSENLVQYASPDQFCINRNSYAVYESTSCSEDDLLTNAVKDVTFFNNLIDAWSMRHFQSQKESGHDHFFAAFSKFGSVTKYHQGEILAEIANRAATQNEQYVEIMFTPDGYEASDLGKKVGWHPDFKTMRDRLIAANINEVCEHGSKVISELENKKQSVLACSTDDAKPGCKIDVRYLYQVHRAQSPESVFAELLTGFELASKDQRIVGINMVQAEDNKIAMRDYQLHMQMIAYLRQVYPSVHVSLHAGELTSMLVQPDELKSHIHDAVEMAHTDRIGHGVDIYSEDHANELLANMAKKHVLVEINLSSNRDILNIGAKDSPLPLYLQSDVPIALCTDDEGITRDPLSKEYRYAVTWWNLSYATIKNFARNSIHYSFLSGKSLWVNDNYKQVSTECSKDTLGSPHPSKICIAFLNMNEKASMQWKLENNFSKFESNY